MSLYYEHLEHTVAFQSIKKEAKILTATAKATIF